MKLTFLYNNKNLLKLCIFLLISIIFIIINLINLNFNLPIEYDEIKYLKIVNLGLFVNYFDVGSMGISEYLHLVKNKYLNSGNNINNYLYLTAEDTDPHILRGHHPILPFYYWIIASNINSFFFNLYTLIFLRISNLIVYIISSFILYKLVSKHTTFDKKKSINLILIFLTILFSSPLIFINTIYISPHIFIFPAYIFLILSILDYNKYQSDLNLYKITFSLVIFIFTIESVIFILPLIFIYLIYSLRIQKNKIKYQYFKLFFSFLFFIFILWPATFLKISLVKIYLLSFYRVFNKLDYYIPGKGNLNYDDKKSILDFIILNNFFIIICLISILFMIYYLINKNKNFFFLILLQALLYSFVIWPIIARIDYVTFSIVSCIFLSSYSLILFFDKLKFFNFFYFILILLITYQSNVFAYKFTDSYMKNYSSYNELLIFIKKNANNIPIYTTSGLLLSHNLEKFNKDIIVNNLTFDNGLSFQFNTRYNYHYYSAESDLLSSNKSILILNKNNKINIFTENIINKFGKNIYENKSFRVYGRKL